MATFGTLVIGWEALEEAAAELTEAFIALAEALMNEAWEDAAVMARAGSFQNHDTWLTYGLIEEPNPVNASDLAMIKAGRF